MKKSPNRKRLLLLKASPSFQKPVTRDAEFLRQKKELEQDLYTFVKRFWAVVDPAPWKDCWHIKVMCEHLEECFKRNITHQLMAIPPGMSKTLVTTVFFPAWAWTRDPTEQFIIASYSQQLMIDQHLKCRKIIASDLYQKYWGKEFAILSNVDNMSKFQNDKMGFRRTTTLRGGATGFRGSMLIVDDPQNINEINSLAMLMHVSFWYHDVMSSRDVKGKPFVRIVIHQRCNQNDLIGEILQRNNKEVVYLRLPMEFELDERCVTVPLKSTTPHAWMDPRQEEGELLCPELGNEDYVAARKKDLSAYAYAAQYQQHAAPISGGIFRKEWFRWWKEKYLPTTHYVLQSWDTAFGGSDTACKSACTTWGLFDYEYENGSKATHMILLNMWVGNLEYPELKRTIIKLANNYFYNDKEESIEGNYKPDLIIMEAKANGETLVQELRRTGMPIRGYNPKSFKDVMFGYEAKEKRAIMSTGLIESGYMWLPAMYPNFTHLYPFAERFLNACATFPMDHKSKDIVDTLSQAVLKLRESKFIKLPEDYIRDTSLDGFQDDSNPFDIYRKS